MLSRMKQQISRKIALSDKLLSECVRELKPRVGEEEEEEPSWQDKPLHGIYQ